MTETFEVDILCIYYADMLEDMRSFMGEFTQFTAKNPRHHKITHGYER